MHSRESHPGATAGKRVKPDNPPVVGAAAYANWGNALAQLGRHAEACEKYARAVETDPRDALAYTNGDVELDATGKRDDLFGDGVAAPGDAR
jgi:tetratricopeptide (TPR) repeat protein